MAYALLARYYDLENADFTDDLDFWLELADAYGDPILELGCGSGRVLLNLARRGHAVTGVDNSPEMLALLEAKLKHASARHVSTPPTIVSTDMLTLDLVGAPLFKLALMPFNTFMHFVTLDEQVMVLTRVRRHLSPGGALALDLTNPCEAYATQEHGLMLERTFADGDSTVQQFSIAQVERATQLAHITWLYDAILPNGIVHRTRVPLTLRYTFPGEMQLLLERCGFKLTHIYGDYDATPLTDDAPRMVVLAEAV